MFITGIIILAVCLVVASFIKPNKEMDGDDDYRVKIVLKKGIKIAGLAIGIILIIFSLIRIVPPGHVAVQVLWGRVLTKSTLGEGLHIVNPFVDLHKMTVRTQAYTMSLVADEGDKVGDDAIVSLTKDGLEIRMDMTIWYHLIPSDASMVYQTIGENYVDKIVRPAARTAIRNSTVHYNAVQIYSEKRGDVEISISEQLEQDFKVRGIALEKVMLRNVSLPSKVKNAIEAKLEAEQDAQKMEFVLQKEQKEAERKKIEAKGIEKAQAIIAQSLVGPKGKAYLSWKYLENLKELYASPNNTVVIAPYDNSFVPLIELGQMK